MKKALYPILICASTLLLISARNLDVSLCLSTLSATPTTSPAPAEETGSEPALYAGWTYEDMDAAVPMFHDGTYPLLKDGLEAAVESYRVEVPSFNFSYFQFTPQAYDVYASVCPMDFGGGAYEDVCADTAAYILDPDLF